MEHRLVTGDRIQMNEDIEVYLDQTSEGSSYLESLIKSRQFLIQSGGDGSNALLNKLDLVINAELDLALMGAEKAKSEIVKATKDNIRPIK